MVFHQLQSQYLAMRATLQIRAYQYQETTPPEDEWWFTRDTYLCGHSDFQSSLDGVQHHSDPDRFDIADLLNKGNLEENNLSIVPQKDSQESLQKQESLPSSFKLEPQRVEHIEGEPQRKIPQAQTSLTREERRQDFVDQVLRVPTRIEQQPQIDQPPGKDRVERSGLPPQQAHVRGFHLILRRQLNTNAKRRKQRFPDWMSAKTFGNQIGAELERRELIDKRKKVKTYHEIQSYMGAYDKDGKFYPTEEAFERREAIFDYLNADVGHYFMSSSRTDLRTKFINLQILGDLELMPIFPELDGPSVLRDKRLSLQIE